VYKNIFLEYIYLSRRIDILGSLDMQPRLENLPSWVPNWSVERSDRLFLGVRTSFASGASSAYQKYLPPDTLEVIGFFHSTLSTIYPPTEIVSDFIQLIRSLNLEKLCSSNKFYVTGEPLLDAYAWILSFGLLQDTYVRCST
jgi:hypothetical protein